MTRSAWKGLAVTGGFFSALAILSPAVGILFTVIGLQFAYRSVSQPGVDPAMKSKMLADGIAEAMNATVIGIGGAIVTGLIGLPLLVVSLVMMSKTKE